MVSQFSILQIDPTELEIAVELLRQLAEYESLEASFKLNAHELEQLLFDDSPSLYAVLAWQDDMPVGIATYYFTVSTFKVERNLFIEDLFVTEEYRHYGIGVALFQHLQNTALDKKCTQMTWKALKWNHPALVFYRTIGAEIDSDWLNLSLSIIDA